MLKFHLSIIISILYFSIQPAQSIEFFQEEIEIVVGKEHCTVYGTYYFKNLNPEEINQMIYYPFFISDSLPYPDSIRVIDPIKNSNIHYKKKNNGILLSIYMAGESLTVIKVIYIQKTAANYMEYILITTRKWGKPLEKADFIIKIPIPYRFKYCSYNSY